MVDKERAKKVDNDIDDNYSFVKAAFSLAFFCLTKIGGARQNFLPCSQNFCAHFTLTLFDFLNLKNEK